MFNSSVRVEFLLPRAVVAKLVDAPDLGSGAERRLGSSPSDGTTLFYLLELAWGMMLIVPSTSSTAKNTSA